MPTLSKPTNGINSDYANRIGLLFDAFNNGNYNFPATQVPSADANTLDDYEEGTFTPTLVGAGGGPLTYNSRVGKYTKIGDLVAAELWLRILGGAAISGVTTITGLPFAASAAEYRPAVFLRNFGLSGVTGFVAGWIPVSGVAINVITINNGGSAATDGAAFIGSAEVDGSFAYHV